MRFFQICTWSLIVCFFAKTEHLIEVEELIIYSLVVEVAASTFSIQLNATNKGKMQ